MNYFIDLTGGMNIRRTPMLADNVIRQLTAGTRVEGDELDSTGKWLKVLIIDGVQTTEPTYIATYTTNGILKTNPVVEPGLAVQVAISFISASPVQITSDGVPVGQEQYNGTIKISPVG